MSERPLPETELRLAAEEIQDSVGRRLEEKLRARGVTTLGVVAEGGVPTLPALRTRKGRRRRAETP